MHSEKPQKEYTLADIAQRVGGTLEGDHNAFVQGLCALEEPVAGCLAFARYTSVKRVLSHDLSQLAGLIVSEALPPADGLRNVNLIRVKEPQKALLKLVPLFHKPLAIVPGVSIKAEIHSSARIGKDVSIGPFCSIGAAVEIGDNVVIYPQVTIYHGASIGAGSVIHAGAVIREYCRIGARSIIQPGAVIGADGFGYLPDPAHGLVAVPQIGTVNLEDEVELGANACVDRATLGTTRVGRGSKLDNFVQIGHNTSIGQHTIVCGHAAIAGSCQIGNQVVIGGNSGIADHTLIQDGVRIAGQAGAFGELIDKGDYAGYPALPAEKWRRTWGLMSFLVKHSKRLRELLGAEGE